MLVILMGVICFLQNLVACRQEKIDQRFNSLDTTSFSLIGEYDSDVDALTIEMTHGYSKDHRPDLKQAVLEPTLSRLKLNQCYGYRIVEGDPSLC